MIELQGGDRIEIDGYPGGKGLPGNIRLTAHGMMRAWVGSLTVEQANQLVDELKDAIKVAEVPHVREKQNHVKA